MRQLIAIVALSVAVAACTSQGMAIGAVESPAGHHEGQVTFTWKSDFANPISGTISGRLPDGTFYTGRYFEVTQWVEASNYAAAWDGWPDPYWSSWGYGGFEAGGWDDFATLYTGRVIANLHSTDREKRLRCRFTLAEPTAGLAGGGSGECQSNDGKTISDVILSEDPD